MSQVPTSTDQRFPVIANVPPRTPPASKTPRVSATVRKSVTTGLHLVVCQVPSDTVYGNFMFLTKASSDKPLAAVVQRLTSCGSQHFQEDFVSKLGREIHAYTGTILHADRSVFTINTENDRGLIAMLPPYLDALFRPLMSDDSYCRHVHTPAALAEKFGRHKGNMYRDLLELSKQKNRSINIDELIYSRNVPYAYNCEGTAESLSQIEIEESRAFHQYYYRPSNCFIVLAGQIDEANVLSVLRAFEDELPESCVRDCERHPAKLACPVSSPRLQRPDILQLFSPEALSGSLTEEERRQSLALSPGLRVRFVSEIVERSARKQRTASPCPKQVHLHLVAQGPDIFDHTDFAAFLLFASHVKHELRKGPWEEVSLEVKERKWPLAVFTIHHLILSEVENAHQEFQKIIEDFLRMPDQSLKCSLSGLIEQAIVETKEQLKWRADYDTVKSVAWWLSACSLSAPGAMASFTRAVHAVMDYEEMAQKNCKWWRSILETGYANAIMILEPAKGGPVSLDSVIKPPGTSSRYSVSSLGSERAFPMPEEFDDNDLMSLKLKDFSRPLLRVQKEVDWCKDQEVRDYCKEIGCFDIREFYAGRPKLRSELSPNSLSGEVVRV
eukprot:Gregarina_sp_Pseudo_9__5159@NODE_550_length_2597_cov_6_321736_g520_i0_p1_GENE_NODE_550_length_2597_cov_6_321736_g520_i0NODE_550_length_2597_cov_6_321736_g520_i0_p1_ORF_typecomplete_len613_score153_97Peptidase_M16_C/PF05193_21/5e03Peptidase_M16_C/PF05193_21/1_3e07Peptidase_M16/PF00675_20/0_084_NODE_550_length_2597_cov_6_321736_g520_i01171955